MLYKNMLDYLRHPFAELITGSIIAISGLTEVVQEINEIDLDLGAHHGVAIYGLVTVLKSVAEILNGIREADTAAGKGKES